MIPREILKKIRQIELRTNRVVTVGIGLCLSGVFSAFAEPRVVTEQRVAVIRDHLACRYFSLTPDLKHVAFVTGEGNAHVVKERKPRKSILKPSSTLQPFASETVVVRLDNTKEMVVVDGSDIGRFDAVFPPILFSSDGQHSAFQAMDQSKQSYAVLDGKRLPSHRQASALKFSTTGGHLAYIAHSEDPLTKKNKYCAVLDSKEQPWCDAMLDSGEGIHFSPDGRRFVWTGFRRCQEGVGPGPMYYFINVDGKEYGPYSEDDRWPVTFSPDGEHFAFLFQRRSTNGDRKAFMMLDGTELPLNSRLACEKVVFSPDGSRLAYVAGGKVTVMEVDGGKKQEWDGQSASGLQFSPDSKRVAFVTKTYNGCQVVVDGVGGPRYFGIRGTPKFSPNSRHVAYVAETLDKATSRSQCLAIIDGVEQKPPLKSDFKDMDIVFSVDGEHFGYLSEYNGRACAVVDGKTGTSFAGSTVGNSLIISSNGSRTAWLLNTSTRPGQTSGLHAVIVDGQMQPRFDAIDPRSLRFSADGKHYAYVVTRSKELGEFVVLDGIKSKTYTSLLPPEDYNGTRTNLFVFDGNNLIRYGARTKTEILIVEEKIP